MKKTYVNYDKIRSILKYNHITIKDLANKIDVPYKTLLYNFQNEADMKVRMLCDICIALDINIKDILL